MIRKGDDYGDWLYEQKKDRELDRRLDMEQEPWNSWHGLHEGDMLEELVEHDSVRFGVPEQEAREALSTYADEDLRKAWWYAIGRHNDAL